jgi:hypothetical protein
MIVFYYLCGMDAERRIKINDLACRQARLCSMSIRFMRERRGLSVEEVAEIAGYDVGTIQAMEQGVFGDGLTIGMIARVMVALDANVPMTFDFGTVNVGAKFGV